MPGHVLRTRNVAEFADVFEVRMFLIVPTYLIPIATYRPVLRFTGIVQTNQNGLGKHPNGLE